MGAAAFAGAVSVAALGLAAVAGTPGPPPKPPAPKPESRPPAPRGSVEIQLLGVNDFHGNLQPPRPGLGGAATLAAHLDRAEREHPGRTIRVHAGDMVGASPLLSSHFHDEPSVRAMNLMDFDVGTLGNHEFDEGGDEMVRLLRGGQRADGLQFKRDAERQAVNTSAPDFEGVRFPYIAANTVDNEGELGLPPTRIVERAGVRVGFIGVTTHETPDYLLARHKQRFGFLDISDTVNRQAARLQRQGVEAIVVLAHSGAKHLEGPGSPAAGEIIDETRDMSDAVDVVIAGHTHSLLNTRVRNRGGRGRQAGDRGEVPRGGLRPRAHDDRPRHRRGDGEERRHAGHARRSGHAGRRDRPARVLLRAPARAARRTEWWDAHGDRCCATAPGTRAAA